MNHSDDAIHILCDSITLNDASGKPRVRIGTLPDDPASKSTTNVFMLEEDKNKRKAEIDRLLSEAAIAASVNLSKISKAMKDLKSFENIGKLNGEFVEPSSFDESKTAKPITPFNESDRW